MIAEFQNEMRFLSNFYLVGSTSVEHVYQAATKTQVWGVRFKILAASTPGSAKKLGRLYKDSRAQLSETERINLMCELVRAKFVISPGLREKLIATGDQVLQEGNNWGDEFWGVNLKTGSGRNELGKILMRIRNELKRGR